jgi:hypothetical protein
LPVLVGHGRLPGLTLVAQGKVLYMEVRVTL